MAAWESVSTLPYNFYRGSSVVLNGEIHILGSSDNGTKHYKYSNGTWTEVSTLPYNFVGGSTVVLDGEIHILGSGYVDNYTKHYKYSNGSWTEVSTLPYNFYYSSAVVLNDEIHILGSWGSGNSTKHYKYSNESWIEVSILPYNFYRGSSVVLDGEIHILGSSNNNYITSHYKYSNGSWVEVSTLPYEFYQGSAVVLDGEIHILGSYYSSDNYTKHYKYYTTINKVVYGDKILLDLTADTVTADKILQGYTAHDASGTLITGSLNPTDITPSESGVYFTSGYKKMITGGYAFSQEPKVEDYRLTYDDTSTTRTSHTVSNMNGKTIFVLLFSWYTSNSYAANRFDGATATGGTIEKICNLLSVTARTQGTFYKLDVTSDTCVISIANSSYIKVFEAVGGVVPVPSTEIETNLWTNPDSTAAFSGQSVTLSDDYTNYDKIRFYYYSYDGSTNVETYVEYAKEEIDKWGRQGNARNGSILGSIAQYYSSISYARPILKDTSGDNKFYFYNAGKVNGSGTGTSVCKPTKITGVTKVVV